MFEAIFSLVLALWIPVALVICFCLFILLGFMAARDKETREVVMEFFLLILAIGSLWPLVLFIAIATSPMWITFLITERLSK